MQQQQDRVWKGLKLLEVNNYVNEIIESIKIMVEKIASISKDINTGVEKGKDVSNKIEEVEKYSKNIAKILRKIENIIIQTTMLAVSGSIEAARAGEFGKGFAVVSSDIRNLAQDASANLEKINDIMMNLDEEISVIVASWTNAMKSNEQEIKDLHILSNEIDALLNEINKLKNNLENLANANNQNLEALKQALQGSEQIAQAVELAVTNTRQSKEAAQLILDTVSEMGNLVEELAVLADELQQG